LNWTPAPARRRRRQKAPSAADREIKSIQISNIDANAQIASYPSGQGRISLERNSTMALKRIYITVLSSCVLGSSAFAGEMADQCVERGGGAEVCACIEEQAEANPEFGEELAALQEQGGGQEAMESLSSEAQETLQQCIAG
jgi:hypothetical protein